MRGLAMNLNRIGFRQARAVFLHFVKFLEDWSVSILTLASIGLIPFAFLFSSIGLACNSYQFWFAGAAFLVLSVIFLFLTFAMPGESASWVIPLMIIVFLQMPVVVYGLFVLTCIALGDVFASDEIRVFVASLGFCLFAVWVSTTDYFRNSTFGFACYALYAIQIIVLVLAVIGSILSVDSAILRSPAIDAVVISLVVRALILDFAEKKRRRLCEKAEKDRRIDALRRPPERQAILKLDVLVDDGK